MINNIVGNKKLFWKVEKIKNSFMHYQERVYFGLQGIENVNTPLTKPLVVIAKQKLADNTK